MHRNIVMQFYCVIVLKTCSFLSKKYDVVNRCNISFDDDNGNVFLADNEYVSIIFRKK